MNIHFGNRLLKRGTKVKSARNRKKRRILFLVLLAVLIAFFLLINFLTDWMWFRELGYVDVFFKGIVTKAKYGIPVFVLLTLLAEVYLSRLRSGYMKRIVSEEKTDLPHLKKITHLMSFLFGLIVSSYFAGALWFRLLECTKSTPFAIKDPIFGLDLSFYIFKLDFLLALNELLILAILLFFLMTWIYYSILLKVRTPDGDAAPEQDAFAGDPEGGAANRFQSGFDFDPGRNVRLFFGGNGSQEKKFSHRNLRALIKIASFQLSALAVVFFLMIAAHFALRPFDLLNTHRGAVYGAGFTDVMIQLPIYRILTVLSLVAAVLTPIFLFRQKYRRLFILPILMVAVHIAGGGLCFFVQNVVVSPDEINKEAPYLAYNIAYTQHAYSVDDVDIADYPATNSLGADDLAAHEETLGNIRINDYEPVKTFYNQTQTIRQYYAFNDIDVDRYLLNGAYKQTYLSIREIDKDKINNTWINNHLKYTHGYGAALSQVNKITPSGQPEVIVRDIPTVSLAPEITLTRPEVYFGELSKDYVIVNTKEDEFAYPDGEANQYTRYEGKAGIRLSPLRRLMFAIREKSFKLLVSTNVKNDSRIIIRRDIADRVRKIMPYLEYEDDPYGVLADGKIYWIIDAYTTSAYYPYSEPYDGKPGQSNYIRNSVKVVVDAYEGTVDYYVADPDDPIVNTYRKIYPSLFKDIQEMPESLRSHIRYPNRLFSLQADVYARYHMDDVKVFYQNEDIWEVSHEIYGTTERKLIPNYFILTLPGQDQAEFVSTLPYSPKSKQNMTGLLITRNDKDHYGELMLLRFPKNRTIYGPMQIEAQIDQSTEISQDFSLWSQAGSKYSRGTLFVVPIKDSLLYMEPIYLEAANSAIPEVKRVIVAYGDRISYERTLAEALNGLFGEGAVEEEPTAEGEPKENLGLSAYAVLAQQAYAKAQEARQQGDWAAFGKHLEELEDALNHLTPQETGQAADQNLLSGPSGQEEGAATGQDAPR